MKILLSPDSFKNSLSAAEACEAMREGILRVVPEAEILSLPGGDGGEGTLDALHAAWGSAARIERTQISGLLGEKTEGRVLLCGEKAAVECADAVRLPRGEKDILHADSYGLGQLIAFALSFGIKELYIALGGSGANDGGLHMLRALGLRALDRHGMEIPRGVDGLEALETVDVSTLHPRLKNCTLYALTDVDNPLLGAQGATYVYAPQKGASPELLPRLESAMAHYAHLMEAAVGREFISLPGSGAAGGIGAALTGVLSARRVSGAKAVLDAFHFSEQCRTAHLVLTAEGNLDGQSVLYGKYPAQVARLAGQANVPVLLFCGGRTEDADRIFSVAQSAVIPLPDRPMSLETSMNDAARLLRQAAENALRCFRMGHEMRKE